MRYLLVGTAPPPGGAGAAALARRASALEAAGDEVVVLSGDLRSAAHRHARIDGVSIAAYLCYYARRFDRLEVRVEPALSTAPGRSGPTNAGFALLGAALGRWQEVTLRVDHPIPRAFLEPGARHLWSAADCVVVADPADGEALARAGLWRGPVVVDSPAVATPASTALTRALADGREIPQRRLVVLVVYERLRHLAALALKH